MVLSGVGLSSAQPDHPARAPAFSRRVPLLLLAGVGFAVGLTPNVHVRLGTVGFAPHLRALRAPRSRARATASAADFEVGDRVRVRKDVTHAALDGGSSRGMIGVVIDTWSICEEDPVCCCAELAADWNVQVVFSEPETWTGYFADDELELMTPMLHWRE